jgi:hypothetical protein
MAIGGSSPQLFDPCATFLYFVDVAAKVAQL